MLIVLYMGIPVEGLMLYSPSTQADHLKKTTQNLRELHNTEVCALMMVATHMPTPHIKYKGQSHPTIKKHYNFNSAILYSNSDLLSANFSYSCELSQTAGMTLLWATWLCCFSMNGQEVRTCSWKPSTKSASKETSSMRIFSTMLQVSFFFFFFLLWHHECSQKKCRTVFPNPKPCTSEKQINTLISGCSPGTKFCFVWHTI